MLRRISIFLAVLVGAGMLAGGSAFAAHAADAQETASDLPAVLREYSVRAYGKRKNHRATIGLENPESVECSFCGALTTDITRCYTIADGFDENACEHYQYGTDVLYHYVDVYQAVCHGCPSVGNLEGSELEDQVFTFTQHRTLIFCEGRSRI